MNYSDNPLREIQHNLHSRRTFLKFCASVTSLLALPVDASNQLAEKLVLAQRPSVIWLSFQECTGCTESFTRSHSPSIESLIFDFISLDYHHTLQAASGENAEEARREAIKNNKGKFLLIVDGSIPSGKMEACSTVAGVSNLSMLNECIKDAAAVIAVGTCSTFGGLPAAKPNPTEALSVEDCMEKGLVAKKPLINISGCPPLPVAISSVLAHYIAFDRFPELDELHRPRSFYANTVHDRCSRFSFYEQEKFAKTFDDEAARKGWCLYELGCKGPTTHNACSIHKWNQGTSNPIEAGHPCIGCSEPNFWDKGGFYVSLDSKSTTDKDNLSPPIAETPENNPIAIGESLYEDNCVYCHEADPGVFKTKPDEIKQLFIDNKIRAHRSFDFDKEELNALESYIKSSKK